ncbi:MAG: 3-oxoacyl-[acyl-carrier-protein] reductase [Bacillota bacterium]|jgi:3-oxoacyl-[acyl-carrier protein] reductase
MTEKILQDKNAVITGGSRGIGRAVALAYAKAGANVAIVYAGNQIAAEETVRAAEAFGVKAGAYCCDVADFAKTKELVAVVKKEFGSVDILVNNAGIVRDGLLVAMKEDDFDAVIATNLKGAFNMTKHTGSLMLRQRSGKIINIASIAGLMGNAGQANYSAAKAGLIALTKTTARELAARGITCNAIAPGFVRTDMTEAMGDNVLTEAAEQIPLKRIGRPEEVGDLAVFLAAADYITGEVIKIDGGLYI